MPVFTEVLPIDNAAGASFQLPNTEDVKIMAVRVTIDNSGGSDTEPELALLAPTGAVIATERQSEAIPAGDSGMASWALRLAKKAGQTSGGDYIFTAAQRENSAPGSVDFTQIPQDARHLVIFGIDYCEGDLGVRLNGDIGNHYRSLSFTYQDENGATSSFTTNDGPGPIMVIPRFSGAGSSAGSFPRRFIIEIPYYILGEPLLSFKNRGVTARAWIEDEEPSHPLSFIAHTQTSGFWHHDSLLAPAINRVGLFDTSGLSGVQASLYRIK